MEGIWECERDPVEKSGSNQNPRKASGGKTMTMQWKVAAGVNELKCVSPSRNNNAQCHQQQCLLHTGCTLKCCNRNIGKLYPSVLYPGYISLEVWSVSIFELSTPSNTDPYLTNPLVPYKHQFLFSPFLSSTFSQSFQRCKNVIKSSIISCTEPYFERRLKYGEHFSLILAFECRGGLSCQQCFKANEPEWAFCKHKGWTQRFHVKNNVQ